MKIGIVGGSGEIGYRLYQFYKFSCLFDNITIFDIIKRPDIAEADFCFLDCTRPIDTGTFRGIDILYYKVGLMGPGLSFVDPLKFYDINTLSLLRTVQVAISDGVQRIVFDSTQSVFGPNNESPFKESDLPIPRSIYGATKLISESYLLNYFSRSNIDISIMRYPRVVGLGTSSGFDNILLKLYKGKPVIYNPSNVMYFDLIHFEDLVYALHEHLKSNLTGVFHFTSRIRTNVVDIVTNYCDLAGVEVDKLLDYTNDVNENDLYLHKLNYLCDDYTRSLLPISWKYNKLYKLILDYISLNDK